MKNLVKAILAVMSEVENIDKNMNVGTGSSSYKAVSDKDVKLAVGKAMKNNGLVILPIEIQPTVKIDRWEEETFYNGQKNGIKTKQSVFTEVNTKYLLMHESGESMEIVGYGHGVDSQDKSAGKATTYALKNTLLYTFLVPTGSIEDTDNKHSDEHDVTGSNTNNKKSGKATEVPKNTPVGIAPGLPKVINSAKDVDVLNTIWNNNSPLHENIEFVKLIASKRVDLATSKEQLTEIFNSHNLLHADSDFVSLLTTKKVTLSNTGQNEKQTA